MSGHNQFNQPWGNLLPSTTDTTTSHPLTAPQYGAPPTLYPRSVDTASTTHGQIHPPPFSPIQAKSSHSTASAHDRSRQPSTVSPTLPQDLTAGLEHHTPALLEHQQWIPDGGNGLSGGGVGGHPQISSGYNSNISRRPAPVTNLPDAKRCRIPDCTYNAYYNVSEREQSEYCGHAHELQAVSTGLVASCAMCKERPRRTNERVCGRTCGERDRQARQVQGTYYGVPVVRREPRARPGA